MFEEYLDRSSRAGCETPAPEERDAARDAPDGDESPPAPAFPSRCDRRRGRRMRVPVWLLMVACMVASCAFGYIGGSLSAQTARIPAADGSETLYQSVVRAAALDAAGDSAMRVPEVAAAVKRSVVEITTETVMRNGRMGQLISAGAGSGVVVSADGFIATNYHVVYGARSIAVRLADGTEYAAEIKAVDAKTDLAVLKIGATGLTPAVFGDSSKIAVGDAAIAVGNPLGELGGTVTSGIISALDREITIDGETMSLLQTDAAINFGNSGGGLFNMYGELIGIVNAKSSGSDIEGLGFAIPINIARTVIAQLTENGYVRGRIDTGLTLVDVQNAQTAMLYRVNRLGLYIYRSADVSLKSGDMILAVNDTPIDGLASFNAALKGFSVGDKIKITVFRNGKGVVAEIVLKELKDGVT
ncbi:MAG: trypsin-like peptidase domain-containing protein [Clostridiales Family XIII bacterium]|jgi:serine protease Do|nr:trypsin-like peptidase domain-containing protein [Clostridiales Family XIII bacterium]